MKKLDQKDLLLSPKVVTDLTGSNNSTGKNDGDNPNASNMCATGHICVTDIEACQRTKACIETVTADVYCCDVSENIETKCCMTPTISVNDCELSEVIMCPETEECPKTQLCPNTEVCPDAQLCPDPNDTNNS